MKKIGCLAGVFSFVLLLAARVSAGEPTAQLSATINEFVDILVNTRVAQLRTSGLPETASLVYNRFDFSEMTKRSLGSHWDTLSNAEQREFVDAFTQRILRAYVGRCARPVRKKFNTGANCTMARAGRFSPRPPACIRCLTRAARRNFSRRMAPKSKAGRGRDSRAVKRRRLHE